jgi:hypothetical protein
MTFIDLYEVKLNVLSSKSTWFLKYFTMRKKSPKPGKSLKIFEIIYLLFLNTPFWRFLQKYPIQALKLIELPHTMSIRLKELIETQRKTQIKDYDAVLNRIYSNYDTDDLSKLADKFLL